MQLTERYSLVDRDTINYEVTVEDPKVFTRPWKMSMLLYRRKEPNLQLLEYPCYSFDGVAVGTRPGDKTPSRPIGVDEGITRRSRDRTVELKQATRITRQKEGVA